MERKQETTYSDPFELLKNMQDVMHLYERPKQNTNPNSNHNSTNDQQLNQTIDDQSTTNSSRQSQKLQKFTYKSFFQSSTKSNNRTMYNNNYENNSANKSKKNILNRSHIINKCQDQNNVTISKQNNQNSIQLDITNNEYANNYNNAMNVQLPQIMRKQRTFYNQKPQSLSSMRSTKTISQKKEERILDLSDFPEITLNQEPDALQLRYEKIKKLKEEFQDIKSQFKIPEPQYFNPSQINNTNNSLYKQKQDLQSRGSINVTQERLKIQDNNSVKNDICQSDLLKQKVSSNKDSQDLNSQHRPTTTSNNHVKQIRELRQAKINQDIKGKINLTTPQSKLDLNSQKFVNNTTVQRNQRHQSDSNIQNKIVKTLATKRRRVIQPEMLDDTKLMERMGNSAIMQLSETVQKTADLQNKFGERRFSNPNKDNNIYNANQNCILLGNNSLINLNIKTQNSVSASVDVSILNNIKNLNQDNTTNKIEVLTPLNLLDSKLTSNYKLTYQFDATPIIKDNSFDNFLINNKSIDFPKFKESIQNIPQLAQNDKMNLCGQINSNMADKPYDYIQRNQSENLDILGISSRSYQQPSKELEIQKSKFSTIDDASNLDQIDQLIENNKVQYQQPLQTKHSSIMRTRNLESIQEEDTGKLNNNNQQVKKQHSLQSHSKHNSQTNHTQIHKEESINVIIEEKDNQLDQEIKTEFIQETTAKQHAGVSLYELYKINQQKQMQLLQKKKKNKELKKLKKQQKINVESVYMREAILALIHSQSNHLNPLKIKQGLNSKQRRMSNTYQQQIQEYQQYYSSQTKRSKSQLQKRKKQAEKECDTSFNHYEQQQQQFSNMDNDLDEDIQFQRQNNFNYGEDKSDCQVQSLTQRQSAQIIQNYKVLSKLQSHNNSKIELHQDNNDDNFINDL